MNQYHKIDSVFKRDPSGKNVLWGDYSRPEFELLKDIEWVWTEKIDGTNIRVMWDGERVKFGGKTDDAQIPVFLLYKLEEMFPAELMASVMKGPACLYGEGYGAKIQKGGGDYIPDGVSFILFDMLVGDVFLDRALLTEIALSLNCLVVPEVGRGPLSGALEFVKNGFRSVIAPGRDSEGLVMRPACELSDRRGKRIITKMKHRDFRV